MSYGQDMFQLWEGQEKPYYRDNTLTEHEEDSWGVVCAADVTEPTLTVYEARGGSTGTAVLILPGGGYTLVAVNHEGHDVAKALAEKGITAGVLKYRLPNPESSDTPEFVPLSDTRRALSLLRSMSQRYGFDRDRVGLLGFSAGSHVATVAGLWKSSDKDENPGFTGLIYGVTRLTLENRKWLETSLYHRALTEAEVVSNSLLDLVSAETPPAFLVHSCDDETCRVEESTRYAAKLREHGVPTEMHLFPRGGHGFGMGRREDGTDQWFRLFLNWLSISGYSI
jgi:acetyl esterase/lipase